MKIIKKATAITVAGILLLAAQGSVFAQEAQETNTARFSYVSGEITEISEYTNTGFDEMDGQKLILITGNDGQLMNFRLTKETYLINDIKPEIGKNAIGFYENNVPAIMIYPPQMPAIVFGVSPENEAEIKVDFFDENLLSADKELKLNIGEDTEILQAYGSKYSGDIKNKNLAVFYTITTKSIPAQTPPIKVVVLPERENAFVPEASDNGGIIAVGPEGLIPSADNKGGATSSESLLIIVNGNKLSLEQAIKKTEVMVPFRAVAEALGYEVGWDSVNKAVDLNGEKAFSLGSNIYYSNQNGSQTEKTLSLAPLLIDGKAYVPFSFFTDVMNLSKAEIIDNEIILENK